MPAKHFKGADKGNLASFMDKLPSLVELVKKELDEKEKDYKEIYNAVRDALIEIKRGIQHIHRGELEEAEKRLEKAIKIARDLRAYREKHPDLFCKHIEPVYQELAEALILLSLFRGEGLPDPEEYGIPPYPYLLGLCDFVGELRRSTLLLIKDGRYGEAEKLVDVMDGVYEAVSTLMYPGAVAPGLRQKVDFVRRIVEITRADVTLTLCRERMLRGERD